MKKSLFAIIARSIFARKRILCDYPATMYFILSVFLYILSKNLNVLNAKNLFFELYYKFKKSNQQKKKKILKKKKSF